MEAVILAAVIVDEPNRHAFLDLSAELDPAARHCEAVDLLLPGTLSTGGRGQGEGAWHGYNLLCRAAVAALEATLRAGSVSDENIRARRVSSGLSPSDKP